MRRLLWLLALCALAVGISLVARFNEGYLLLVLPPYRVDISLNLAMFLLLVVFLLFYGLLRACVLTASLRNRVRIFRDRRNRERAEVNLADAVRLLLEGRFGQALKKADEAYAAGYSPAPAALLAGRAALLVGEPERAKAWLDRASLADPRMETARLMLEARMYLDMQQYENALATLQRLQRRAGRHIAALRLELRAQQGCGNRPEALRLARLLAKHGGLLPELAKEIVLKSEPEPR